MGKKWSRANKIGLFGAIVAVIALIIAALPYAADVWRHFSGPSAAITEPAPGSVQPNNMFGAQGTSRNIPDGDDLWLVVRSGIEARWYPVTRIVPVNGPWIVGGGLIRPALGSQIIELIMLSDSNEASFINYVKALQLKQLNPGLSSLPNGYTLLASAQIQVQ